MYGIAVSNVIFIFITLVHSREILFNNTYVAQHWSPSPGKLFRVRLLFAVARFSSDSIFTSSTKKQHTFQRYFSPSHNYINSQCVQYNLCKTAPLKTTKNGLKTNYHLMQVKSIAECSKGSILQYFRPSLSSHLSLRSLFVYF